MFDTDMSISGKHAFYWKALCKTPGNAINTSDNFKIFDHYIYAYMIAPIIGLINHRKGTISEEDKKISDNAGMLAEIQIKYKKRLKYIYQLIILTDDTLDISDEDRVRWAFSSSDDDVIKGIRLYNDYFRGGLEILYETFVNQCTTDDDFLNQILNYVKQTEEEYKTLANDGDIDLDTLLQ